ncbi:hypothetical protein BC332_25982 [Capsicum chinense]|nr:hypothetical protein BC332_25982 [Capsicum chinense]
MEPYLSELDDKQLVSAVPVLIVTLVGVGSSDKMEYGDYKPISEEIELEESRKGTGASENHKSKFPNGAGSCIYTTYDEGRKTDCSARGRGYTNPEKSLEHNVGRICTGGSPFFKTMENYITHVGNFVSKPKVLYHDDCYYIFKFATLVDKDLVLQSRPYRYRNRLMILRNWLIDFEFKPECLHKAQVPELTRTKNQVVEQYESEQILEIGKNANQVVPTATMVENMEKSRKGKKISGEQTETND